MRDLDRKKQTDAEWARANPAARAAANARWRNANPHQVRAIGAAWARANPENIRSKKKRWRTLHPDRHAASERARKASRIGATPEWAHRVAMAEFYALAAIKTRLTGEPWQVDHIVPLRSLLVCGLHAHNNLQVIRGVENSSKGNRHWPDMPDQETQQ